MTRPRVYIHAPNLPGVEAIREELVGAVSRSGLGNAADLEVSARATEMQTLLRLWMDAHQTCDNGYVLYCHTKGVTRPGDGNVADWRRLMMHWCIAHWRDCLAKLEGGYDVCGVNWQEEPAPHFSGNFWWAREQHIRYLPEPKQRTADRREAEFWIGGRDPRVAEMWHSGVDHYATPYPRRMYAGGWRDRCKTTTQSVA